MLATAEKPRAQRTDDERRRMVHALDNRGEGVTAEQVAERFGVSVPLLYHWRKRIKEGEPLDLRAAKKASTSTALAKSKPAPMTVAPRTKRAPAHEIVTIETTPSSLTESERDELVRLRAENASLKRALVSGLSLHDVLRGG
jgi:transposase-like protein